MTINPESVKERVRELLEAEERGRREVNAELLAACKRANKYLADIAMNGGCRSGMEGILEWSEVQGKLSAAIRNAEQQGVSPAYVKGHADGWAACNALHRKAIERQGEAMEVGDVGNRGAGG